MPRISFDHPIRALGNGSTKQAEDSFSTLQFQLAHEIALSKWRAAVS
jgi:hypothetical protein